MSIESRIQTVLAELSKLSEASTLKLGGRRGKPDSTPPPGAKPDHKGAPDPDDSLLVWFLYKLEHATSDLDKLGLVAQTEIRIQKRVDGKVARAIKAGAFGLAMSETAEDRDDRIVDDYVDLHPIEVAAVESERSSYCSPANVRKVRYAKGRDAETGRMTKKEHEDEEYALELRAQGLSLGAIAIRIGRPRSTVQSWVEKKAKAA